jgi:hypothetical protein
MTLFANKLRISPTTAAAALFVCCAWAHASLAQNADLGDGPIACGDFQRGPNGSWTVLHPTMISPSGVTMNLAPGQTFAKNQFLGRVEVTTVLDRHCGNL